MCPLYFGAPASSLYYCERTFFFHTLAGKPMPKRQRQRREPGPRDVALDAALAALAGRRVREAVRESRLSAGERPLAERIAIGSIKRHLTLDNVVAAFSRKRHRSRVFEAIIRQAVYQLWFMNVEPAVVVNAAVELAKRVGGNAARSANALLRRIASLDVEKREGFPSRDEWRRSVFLASDEGGPACLLFPRRIVKKDPRGDLESASGLPAFLAWRWCKRFGEERFWRFVDWANSAPPLIVRVNSIKLGDDPAGWDLGMVFSGAGGFEQIHEDGLPPAFFKLKDASPADMPGFAVGLFSVQDPANARAVDALCLEPGLRILDLCAAPGSKTIQIAEKIRNDGEVIACDISPSRLRLVKENAARTAASCIRTVEADATDPPHEWLGAFDRVLLDVPCSNTGALSRRPEVRLRISEKSILELAAKQKRLLEVGLAALRSGGILVYSTCSLEPEENEKVIDTIQERFEVFDEWLTEPELGKHDGAYFAAVRKG